MKKQLLSSVLAVGTLAIGCLGQVSSAEAVTITRSCATGYSNNVDANPTGSPFNLGCELGTVNNDFVPGGISTTPNANHQVNKDSMFSFTDWLYAGKDEANPGNDFLDFSSFPTNRRSGTYNLNNIVQSSWTDVMLVLKGGNGERIDPRVYVGYLLAKDSNGGWTGTWKTPFDNTNSPTLFDANVSHISLYYREGTTPIPTPALLPGLIGMGAAALRKKKREGGTEEVTQEA